MKKVLVFCVTLLVVASLMLTAVMAAPKGFVSSPTGQSAPELIGAENSDEDCQGEVIITPYSEKDDLNDDHENDMDDAYDSIVNSDNLSDLNSDLKDAADKAGVKDGNLAVSDLFHVDFDCDEHEGHGEFSITIKPETLKNFVGLMYYDGEKWVYIDDAKVNGDHLNFSLKNPAPVAIFVNSAKGSISTPQTGDDFPWIYVAVIAASAIGLAVVIAKLKKREV